MRCLSSLPVLTILSFSRVLVISTGAEDPPAPASMPTKPSSLLVKNIKLLATFDKEHGDIKNAAIYVEGPEIVWVGQMGSLPEHYQKASQEVDLSECVVIPGAVSGRAMSLTLYRSKLGLPGCVADTCLKMQLG